MDALSINYSINFINTCESTLKRVSKATTDMERRAILNRETVRGIEWAIEFVKGLQVDYMNERELNHAIRLCHFRGATCPVFHN